jgi:hypothetical protein
MIATAIVTNSMLPINLHVILDIPKQVQVKPILLRNLRVFRVQIRFFI